MLRRLVWPAAKPLASRQAGLPKRVKIQNYHCDNFAERECFLQHNPESVKRLFPAYNVSFVHADKQSIHLVKRPVEALAYRRQAMSGWHKVFQTVQHERFVIKDVGSAHR